MDLSFLGLAGLVLLILAWVPQTADTVRRKHSGLVWQFDALYAAGSIVLAYYSLTIGDLVFTLLNSLAAYMALIGLYYKVAELIKRGNRKKTKPKARK
jgi:MtN3 and saliva related transmembrane protein